MLYGAHNMGDDVTGEEHGLLSCLLTAAGNAYDRVEAILLQQEVAMLSHKLDALPYDIAIEILPE